MGRGEPLKDAVQAEIGDGRGLRSVKQRERPKDLRRWRLRALAWWAAARPQIVLREDVFFSFLSFLLSFF